MRLRVSVPSIAPKGDGSSPSHTHPGRITEQLIESWCKSIIQRWFRDKGKEMPADEPATVHADWLRTRDRWYYRTGLFGLPLA